MATAAAAEEEEEEEEGEGGSGRATEVEVPCYGVSVCDLVRKGKGILIRVPINHEYIV